MGKMMRDNNAEVLEDVIFPKLVEIQNQIKESESRVTTRIDNVAKILTETKTNHERRIKGLEDEVGIFAD